MENKQKVVILDKDYRIEADTYNFVLIKEKTTSQKSEKSGEFIVQFDKWYCNNRKHALERYMTEIDRENSSIQEVLESYKNIEKLINNL